MKKILAVVSFALVTIFAGCNKEDKLWDAIDALKNRVEALETQVKQLNTNVDALTALHQAGATVISSEKDPLTGTWKIKLSDGREIDLKQGTEASATIPVMAINAAGNWEVSYDNGTTFTEIKRGTPPEPVKAETVSPLFRVDNDGYWQVSYDGGANYQFVFNQADQKVYAFKDGAPTDSFFTSVEVVDGELVIVMKNGEKLSVPVVKDFYCIIKDVPTDPIKFDAGAVKMYTVELKGVDATMVTAPEGWSAKLGAATDGVATLTVTAPATTTITSKAATADTKKDIAILATSNKYATIAKMQVELIGSGEVAPPTVTSVTENTALKTPTSLTFDVALSTDAAGVKYICQLTSAQAPTIQNVIENGTAVVKTSLPIKVENLLSLTAYKIYVVAYKGTSTITYGDVVVNVEATTKTDVIDYYEDGITIEGVTYDKDSEGAELLSIPANASADVTILTGGVTAKKVLFLESASATYKFVLPAATLSVKDDLVIIGRNSNKKPVIAYAATSFFALSGRATDGDTRFIAKNVAFDATARTNYMFNNQSATKPFGLFMFEDCKFIGLAKPVYYRGTANQPISNIIVRSSVFQLPADVQLFSFDGNVTCMREYKNFEFTNNILYGINSAAPANANKSQVYATKKGVVNSTQTTSATDVWDNVIKVTNNTFVNFYANGSLVSCLAVGTLDITKNIFQVVENQASASYLYYLTYSPAVTPGIINPVVNVGDNVVYGGGTTAWAYYNSASDFKEPAGNSIDKVADAPLSTCNNTTGVFVRSPAMVGAGIGSSLK